MYARGSPRLDHEPQLWREIVRRPEDPISPGDKRVIGLQRNEDRAVAALGDEVEAVIEELAEEREPGIERRREAHVRRLVRDEEDRSIVGGTEDAVQARAGDDLHAVLQDVVGGVKDAIRAGIEGGGIGRRVV